MHQLPTLPLFSDLPLLLQRVPLPKKLLDKHLNNSAITSRGELLMLLLKAWRTATKSKHSMPGACPTRFALLPSQDVVSCSVHL
jgi:hypothetical protein